MSLWLVRSGRYGEHEQKFFDTSRIYLTWAGLKVDLSRLKSQSDVVTLLESKYPEFTPGKIRNHAGQIWAFSHRMNTGDLVVIPSKQRPAINLAEIHSGYEFNPQAEDPYYHSRTVQWVARDIPRSVFGQDLLYSFGAIQTICEIKRNDAERRVREVAIKGVSSSHALPTKLPTEVKEAEEAEEGIEDLEEYARDEIAKLIIRKFKGHGLERVVEAVLKAQGYTTYHSPMGADKGIDLLAAPGPMGFGQPRICVQVKSGDTPVDSPTLSQLIGTMQTVRADQGLLVSWGGFKSSVDKEAATQFFRVRLWDQRELITNLLDHYDALDATMRAEIPLKRIWAVADSDEQ